MSRPPAEAQRCTCPSGDGSLRWPCPAHPPSAPVGVELSALRVQEWLQREYDILPPVQEIEQAMRTPCSCPDTERGLAQQPAAVDGADAKDAEIERLRAERDTVVNEAAKYAERSGRAQAEVDHLRRGNKRLAEALRGMMDKWDRIGDEHGVRQFTGNDHKLFANELRALLRDHDQETKK